eukprot:gene6679-biopygen4482
MSNSDHEPSAEDKHADEPVNEEEGAPAFFSLSTFKVAQVNMINGLLNGYSIGFVGPYSTLFDMSENCNAYYKEEPCVTLANSNCKWRGGSDAHKQCIWAYQQTCSDITAEPECDNYGDCEWSYADKDCHNKHGYNAVNNGIFAGAMILGSTVGSVFGGYIVTLLGLKRTFFAVGLTGIVCSVCYHLSTAFTLFWLLCTGRAVIGFVLALVCIASPMYVNMHAHPKNCKSIGVLFQVFNTLGICLAATMGLIVGQTVSYHSNTDVRIKGRMQGFCAGSTLLAVCVTLLGIFLDDGTNTMEEDGDNKDEAQRLNQSEYSWGEMIGPLMLGGIVSGTLQLTGINAVMNYAPTIMESLGMDPLMGNFVVMVWNFVTTIVSIPLASFISMRHMFLGGSLVTSVSCLLLCGIPVYPGVADKNVKDGVAITGILIFIAAFEIGVGPCFYVLAQDLFPPSFRPKGSSVTMLWQFFFNLIINVFYPTATKGISGGASGDQDKGQSVAFIFFGAVGLVCFVVEIFFLFPWEDNKSGAGDAAAPAPADESTPALSNDGGDAEPVNEEQPDEA